MSDADVTPGRLWKWARRAFLDGKGSDIIQCGQPLSSEQVEAARWMAREIQRLRAELTRLRSAPVAVGSLPDFTDDSVIREAIKMGMMLEATKPDPMAVEVPELTETDLEDLARSLPSVEWCLAESDPVARAAYSLAASRAHAIPPSRILKDGEREELETWKRIAQDAERERDEAQSAVARLLAWKRTILARMGALLDSATNARGAFSSDALRSSKEGA